MIKLLKEDKIKQVDREIEHYCNDCGNSYLMDNPDLTECEICGSKNIVEHEKVKQIINIYKDNLERGDIILCNIYYCPNCYTKYITNLGENNYGKCLNCNKNTKVIQEYFLIISNGNELKATQIDNYVKSTTLGQLRKGKYPWFIKGYVLEYNDGVYAGNKNELINVRMHDDNDIQVFSDLWTAEQSAKNRNYKNNVYTIEEIVFNGKDIRII